MSILKANGSIACTECGRKARAEYDQLKFENDKLRELAAETIYLMQANCLDCGLCKHYCECWTGEAMNYSPSGCIICNDARELGVEVDR